MVAITVTDTGVGLSPDDQERIFAKFYRSDDPRVGREGGWGLGLTLTRSIIERMGGRITVESSLNEGASFRILLPVAGSGI
jgi:signal transduction histidine kinase